MDRFKRGDHVRFKPEFEHLRKQRGLPETQVIETIREDVALFEGGNSNGAYLDRLERVTGPW